MVIGSQHFYHFDTVAGARCVLFAREIQIVLSVNVLYEMIFRVGKFFKHLFSIVSRHKCYNV